MKNKKIILSSILSLVLCFSLIVGGTFALFTSTTKTNIAITSGNVEVVAWLDDIEASTFGEVQAEKNTFELGGSATYDATANKLTIDKIAPGDRVDLNVYIENKSNIAVQYRVKVAFAGELQDALVATIELPQENGATVETVLTSTDVATDWNEFDETNQVKLPMSVALPYDVGNDYMNKSAEITVTVEAIQANATELVMIENTRYATFADALNAANAGDTIVIGGVAEYDFGTESNQTVDAKGVTVSGMDGTSLVFSGDGANNTFSNVKLENLTVVDTTTSYGEDAWEMGYLELADITATDVVFANGIMLDGTNSFTSCTFTGKTESGLKMYGAWVNSGNATFTNCTFVGTRGLKAHEAYESEITNVTVDGCAFNGMTEKPGIALGDLNTATTVTLKNNTFTDTQPGDGAYIKNHGVPYQYETDTDVTTFTFVAENNSTILNVYTADDLWEITNISNTYTSEGVYDTNAATYTFADATVNLMADIDFAGASWRAIGRYPNGAAFCGTFNGNGHTISNFKYDPDDRTVNPKGTGYNSGFFGSVGPGAVIKDLTIDGANVRGGNSNSGALVGFVYAENGSVAFENITVKNAFIHQGRQSGGIVGQVEYGTVTFTNCKVVDSAMLTYHNDVKGAIYAANSSTKPAAITVTGCSYENVIMMKNTNWTEFYDWTLDQIVEKYSSNAASGNVQ